MTRNELIRAEVQRLLHDLRSAWEAIAPEPQAAPEAVLQTQGVAHDALAPKISGLVKA